MAVNYTPSFVNYTGQGKFRFWCQSVLPLVYDDSLSYMELLNKMVIYLNRTIQDVAAVETNVDALLNAYNQLQTYVNDYFDNLDVQDEINVKLDGLVEDGTMDELLEPFVTAQIPGLVESGLPGVVEEQIPDVVAGQIDGVVADQINGVVAEQIPEQVTDWLDDKVTPVGSAVIVDNSLTISGAAADAKAVGDALTNFAPPYSSSATYAVGDYVLYNNVLYRCNTPISTAEAWTDTHWTAVKLGPDVADLKTQLHQLGNNKNLLWISQLTENKYYYGSAATSELYSYFAVKVENGKTYKSATQIRFISRAGEGILNTDTYTYTATADETIYFTLYNNYRNGWALCESSVDISTIGTYDHPTLNDVTLQQNTGNSNSAVMSQSATTKAIGMVNTNANKVRSDNDIFASAIMPSPNLYKPYLIGYLLDYSNGQPIVSANYETSDFISVTPGDEIHYQFDYGGVRRDSVNYSGYSTMRTVCAYRWDKSYISNSYVTSAASYIVPENAEYIRVSFAVSTTFTNRSLIKTNSTDIVPFFEPLEVTYIAPKYLTPENEYRHFNGEYSEEIDFKDLETSAKAMLLNAVIEYDTLPTFELGIKNTSKTLFKVYIDATKLYVFDYAFGSTSSTTTEYTHGLTLGKDISISAMFNNKGAKISVCSGGEKYEMPDYLQITRAGLGYPYFIISSGTANYVSVSACAREINRYIWLFGDSYLSDSADRWAYYLNQSGAKTYMIDAYSGENSANALKSLQNLLKIGHPSYVVWCLGMNDGSDNNEPRPAWKSAFDEVKRLCEIYKIEMIGATIPTVPNINNEYKNAYVKQSGLKYIDFAKAVGATSTGVWYDGMIYSDNIHPTAKGARALYYTAITDFEQLLIEK